MTNTITIMIGGEAGHGIQTIGNLLARVCLNAGLFVFSMDEFESRIRGGHSFHLLKISNQPVNTPSLKPDILVAIDEKTYKLHRDEITSQGIILKNKSLDDETTGQYKASNVFDIPLQQLAKQAGSAIVSNTVAAGAVLAVIGAKSKDFQFILEAEFKNKGKFILDQNLRAGEKGFKAAEKIEFPRFVFAPGGIFKTFNTVKKAVWLSEKYQVPSIILMDHFLINSARTLSDKLEAGCEHEMFLENDTKMYQQKNYLRYKHSATGVSPRKIPCFSDALVRATGNEHTEEGLTFEGAESRNAMVEKRFKKLSHMKQEISLPSIFSDDSAVFLTGWGSSKNSIQQACLHLREQGFDIGWIIFEDIWPMNTRKLAKMLKNKKLFMVEGNSTSQLGNLIRQQTGIDYASSILKYDGRPIYPEYIIEKVKDIIG